MTVDPLRNAVAHYRVEHPLASASEIAAALRCGEVDVLAFWDDHEVPAPDAATSSLVPLEHEPFTRPEHSFGIAGVRWESTWLDLPADLSYEDYEHLAFALGQVVDMSRWAIGELADYGEARWGEKYAQAIEATGRRPQTLINYASVARRVPRSVRRASLSWSHHAEVASLPATDQDRWLSEAEANGWTLDDLRERVRVSKLPAPVGVVPELSAEEEVLARSQQQAALVPPHDIEAEEYVLGAMMLSEKAIVAVSNISRRREAAAVTRRPNGDAVPEAGGNQLLAIRTTVEGAGGVWTPNTLTLPGAIRFDAWSDLVVRLALLERSVQWWIGDAIHQGEALFPDRYAEVEMMLEAAGASYSRKTIRNLAWVAGKVAGSRRRDLSFGHHSAVAGLSRKEQRRWLARAEADRWSVHELRRRLRAPSLSISESSGADIGIGLGAGRVTLTPAPYAVARADRPRSGKAAVSVDHVDSSAAQLLKYFTVNEIVRAVYRQRIAALSSSWYVYVDEVVAAIIPYDSGDAKEQRIRNAIAGKQKRKLERAAVSLRIRGFGVPRASAPRPTVTADRRRFAEEELLAWIESNPDDPVAAQLQAEIDELEDIQERLAATDPDWARDV